MVGWSGSEVGERVIQVGRIMLKRLIIEIDGGGGGGVKMKHDRDDPKLDISI